MYRNFSCILVSAFVLTTTLVAIPTPIHAQAPTADANLLEFRVLADRTRDQSIIDVALGPNGLSSPPVGFRWIKVGETSSLAKIESLILRDIPVDGEKPAHRLVLIKVDRQNLTGSDVRRFRSTSDEHGSTGVEAVLNPSGARRLGSLLREKSPEKNAASPVRVATVVEGSVISVAVLSGDGKTTIGLGASKKDEIDRLLAFSPDARARNDSLKLFDDAKFGLVIHWGLDPLVEREPAAGLSKFKGESFDADALVNLAKLSGAKFLVVPVRNSDGFAFFETRYATLNARDAPFAKDPLKLILDAARKGNMPVYLNYSVENRSSTADTKAGEHLLREQIRELGTAYGDIAGFLLEGRGTGVDSAIEMIHDTQPAALVMGPADLDGDIRSIPLDRTRWDLLPNGSTTLLRLTIDGKSSLSTSDLVSSVVEAAGRGAILALDVTLEAPGSIPKPVADRLGEVGRWFTSFGESIHGTRPGPIAPTSWGVSTRKGDLIYVHVLRPDRKVLFPLLSSPEIKSARLFGDRKADGFGFGTNRAMIETGGVASAVDESYILLPDAARSPIDTIVILNPPPPSKKPVEPKPKDAPGK